LSELVLRLTLLILICLALPLWYRSVPSPWLRIQTYVFILGLILLVWLNPIFTIAQWNARVSNMTRLASDMTQALSNTCFRIWWLCVMSYPSSTHNHVCCRWIAARTTFGVISSAIQISAAVLRLPSDTMPSPFVYAVLEFLSIGLTWLWLFWLVRLSIATSITLTSLDYMTSRHEQLSYRFLFLESILMYIYLFLESLLRVTFLIYRWWLDGTDAFIDACVHASSVDDHVPPLEKAMYLSIVVFLILWVHLPARERTIGPAATTHPSSRWLSSTAFYVQEHHCVNAYGQWMREGPIFCLETAEWLVQLAWQAYFDPMGHPTRSGAGLQTLETYGFELVCHLRHELLDTYAIVCFHPVKQRLVVAFRGSVSKAHWKTNMRFHQVPLFMKECRKHDARHHQDGRQTCRDKLQNCLAQMPVVNLALPRVHSGAKFKHPY
jgi:hypothetical protein